MSALLFEVSATDAITLSLVPLTPGFGAILASLAPALRATRVHPNGFLAMPRSRFVVPASAGPFRRATRSPNAKLETGMHQRKELISIDSLRSSSRAEGREIPRTSSPGSFSFALARKSARARYPGLQVRGVSVFAPARKSAWARYPGLQVRGVSVLPQQERARGQDTPDFKSGEFQFCPNKKGAPQIPRTSSPGSFSFALTRKSARARYPGLQVRGVSVLP
jgi:hypothetical protein